MRDDIDRYWRVRLNTRDQLLQVIQFLDLIQNSGDEAGSQCDRVEWTLVKEQIKDNSKNSKTMKNYEKTEI